MRLSRVLVPAVLVATAVTAVPPPAWGAGVAPNTILVHPRGASGTRALSASPDVTGTLAALPGGARLVRVDTDPRAAAARLARRRGISWAEPNVLVHATGATGGRPDDPLFAEQSDLAAMHASAGWLTLGLGGFPASGGVPVGIVDTGIDANHEDLRGRVSDCGTATDGRVADGACADDDGHGTHVAGTIGARTGNHVGMAGLAFSSPLLVCRALSANGSGTTADVAACVAWLHDRGARVISMSLGGPSSRTLAAAVVQASARGSRSGSLLVAAAGNDGNGSLEYPAALPQVVSVAATDDAGGHAPFSNTNADVEIAAPGVDVLSAKLGGGYVRESGTSMAAPHVAAVAALLWGAAPGLTAAAIRSRLDATTLDAGPAGRDPEFGFGRLDLGLVRPSR